MTPDPITAAKFFTGVFSPKTAVKSVAMGLWLIVFVLAGFTIWKAFFAKTESYAQHVEAGGNINNIEIYNPEDTFFLGLKFWGFKIGISRPTVKKIKDITAEVKPINK